MLTVLKYGLYFIQEIARSVVGFLFRTLLLTPCNDLVLGTRWIWINRAPINIQVLFQHGYPDLVQCACLYSVLILNTADHYTDH